MTTTHRLPCLCATTIYTLMACLLAGCSREAATRISPKPTGPEASIGIQLLLNHPLKHSKPLPTADSEIGRRLVEIIDSAEITIEFAIYGLRRQDDVLAALKAAKSRGVLVRGVVDRDLKDLNYYSDTEKLVAAIGDVKDDWEADKATATKMKGRRPFRSFWPPPTGFEGPPQCVGYSLPNNQAVIAVHASREPLEFAGNIMHNKFFVIDRRYVWTGSCNVSDTGTGGYNANIAAVIDSPKVADRYWREFLQMYESGLYHSSKHKHPTSKVPGEKLPGGGDLSIYFSPNEDAMESGIRPLLQAAQSTINVTVFFLTHKKITGDLIAAHQRGVKVRVILDATAAKNGYTKHEILRSAGIAVKVENWGGKMHMKAASIDGRFLIMGSMNWTSSGERKNDENTLVLDFPDAVKEYDTFFEDIWKSVPDRWLTDRPDPESRESGTSWTDGVDNDFDHLVDLDDPGCQENPPPLPSLPPFRIVPKKEGFGLIKGNINRKGKRYYHLPNAPYYDKTIISVDRGERWFPSIEEARAAGWKRPPKSR